MKEATLPFDPGETMHPRPPFHPPRPRRAAAATILLVVAAGCGGAGEQQTEVEGSTTPPLPPALIELVEAERAFARRSVDEGTRAAFLAFFDAAAVSFTPAPVLGTDHIEEWPAEGPVLDWAPEWAEVSSDGDLGYTTGPFRSDNGEGAVGWGHYHSVWERDAAGGWQVVLDIGVPHGPVPWPVDEVDGREVGAAGAGATEPILEADFRFAEAWRTDGAGAAARFVAPDARRSRTGQVPVQGREAWQAEPDDGLEPETWTPRGGGAAASGDLGYTWGVGRTVAGPEDEARDFSYARVWRGSDGSWQVVLEVVALHPPG